MKKILTIVLATLLLTTGLVFAEDINKSQYVTERFQTYGYEPNQADIDYWSTTSRNIYGTLEDNLQRRFSQNKFLEDTSSVLAGEPIFGATPFRPSEFKTNLSEQKTEGHSDTTLKVTSITTKDGATLDGSILGDTIVLSINPTGSNSEIVLCTGLTTATKTFTGCTFGQRFDQSGSTSANVEAHAPGEPVVISNSDTYLTQQYVTIDGDDTLLGSKAVASSTEAVTRFYFGDNRGAYIWYNTTTDQFGWASSTTEFQFNSEGTQFSVGPTLKLSSGVLDVNTSTSGYSETFLINTGGFFDLSTTTASSIHNFWNDRFNATSTHPGLFTFGGRTTTTAAVIGSTVPPFNPPPAGSLFIGGNATTTGSLTAGEWCDTTSGACLSNIVPTGIQRRSLLDLATSTEGLVELAPTANTVYVYPVEVKVPIAVDKIISICSSCSGGGIWGFGIYDLSGTQVWESKPIAASASNTVYVASSTMATTTPLFGSYLLAFTSTGTTASPRGSDFRDNYFNLVNGGSDFGDFYGTAANAGSSGDLPATLGTITAEQFVVPWAILSSGQ